MREIAGRWKDRNWKILYKNRISAYTHELVILTYYRRILVLFSNIMGFSEVIKILAQWKVFLWKRWSLQLQFDFDSTAIRLLFDIELQSNRSYNQRTIYDQSINQLYFTNQGTLFLYDRNVIKSRMELQNSYFHSNSQISPNFRWVLFCSLTFDVSKIYIWYLNKSTESSSTALH